MFCESTRQRRFEWICDSIADGVIVTNNSDQITYLNASAETRTGWSLSDALGKPLETVFQSQRSAGFAALANGSESGVDQLHREGKIIRPGGECIHIHFKCTPLVSNTLQVSGSVIVFTDLSERLQLKSDLLHQASHDPLTNLINRREFEARVQAAIEEVKSTDAEYALCYLDLDQFKIVNDTCGHIAGDELLRQVAVLFKGEVRGADTLARLGGDEFGILLKNCSMDTGIAIVNRLLAKMQQFQFSWEDRIFSVGVSIGLVPVTRMSSDVVTVLRDADSACYAAKESGRNRLHVLSNNSDEFCARRQQALWVEKIERALANDEFVLYSQAIQPSFDSDTANARFEILLRLRGDDGELILPDQFLPAAERFGLATMIDRWVIENTLKWLAANTRCVRNLQMCAINLSGQSLGDDEFLPFVKQQFRQSAIDPAKICFEITETASVANLSCATVFICALKELGCLFSLDDFGSGFSSFAYLKTLPVDFLKIDGLFVRDIVDNELDFAMVRSINEIGQILGKQTIAEFVENDDIRDKLKLLGVNFVQGYGVGMPQALECWLEQPPEMHIADAEAA